MSIALSTLAAVWSFKSVDNNAFPFYKMDINQYRVAVHTSRKHFVDWFLTKKIYFKIGICIADNSNFKQRLLLPPFRPHNMPWWSFTAFWSVCSPFSRCYPLALRFLRQTRSENASPKGKSWPSWSCRTGKKIAEYKFFKKKMTALVKAILN